MIQIIKRLSSMLRNVTQVCITRIPQDEIIANMKALERKRAPFADRASTVTDSPRKHGIDHAAYYGGPGEPYYRPVLECLCGWSTSRADSWEDAGRELDEHLKGVKK